MSTFPVSGYKGKVNKHWGSNIGGSDLFAAKGTPVLAMVGGTVTYADYSRIGGWNVTIQGDDGLEYYYAHLAQAPDVQSGSQVQEGQQIGLVGDTGNAENTGAHLHIGIGQGIVSGSGAAGGTGKNYDATGALTMALNQEAGSPAQGGAPMPAAEPPQNDPDQIIATATIPEGNITYIEETHADGRVTRRHWEGAQGVGATTILGIPVGGEQVPPAGQGRWVDDGLSYTDEKVAAAWEKKQASAARETSVSAPPTQKYIVSRDAQGNEQVVPNPNYISPEEKARPTRVAASPDEPNIVIMQPDGTLTSVPNPNYQPRAAKPSYQAYGRRIYRINPQTGDLEFYTMVPEDPRDPLAVEYDRLRNAKMRQELIPPIQKLLQDREAALQYVQGELTAGRMTSAQGNAYMAQIDAQAQAALKGTTIFQQQEAERDYEQRRQQMGASMLNQRVQSGGSILGGIFQSLQSVMMPKGQTSLGIDPVNMVQEALNTFGGGQESYAFAKGLLMGAGIGQEGVQAAAQGASMPGGGPAAGQQAPAALGSASPKQAPVDTEAVWRQIQANPQQWGLIPEGASGQPMWGRQPMGGRPPSPLPGPSGRPPVAV